jgi:NEDD8-activating enzyme E1 regulatory subunit
MVQELGDISKMSDHDHGHIPYLVILLYYLKEWQDTHDGQAPSTFKEKTAFRDFVRDKARTSNPEGGEENFDEACAAVLKSISDPPVGSGCKDMFALDSCSYASITAESANFWVIAHSIRQFYEKHGVLPLPGSVPDMKATSEGYIKLQNIYKSKARKDVAEVTDTVRSLEKSLSRASPIDAAEIEAFCKNASHVRVLTNPENKPLPTARFMFKASVEPIAYVALKAALELDFNDMVPIYIALNQQYLSQNVESWTSDEEKQGLINKCTEEVRRAKGAEMHNISSVTGGMVAQEAIKLLTRQYVPVNGVCVFDGIRAKAGVAEI